MDTIHILRRVKLFEGIAETDLASLLRCLGSYEQGYSKGDFIVLEGDETSQVGILLAGTAWEVREDYRGERTIISRLAPADIFGEVFACAQLEYSPVTIEAASDCRVLFVNYQKIIRTCPGSCIFHDMLIKNMLRLIAEKILQLNKKIEYLHIKSLRGRISAFLLDFYSDTGSGSFTISLDRAGLADYLNADRSALSRELSRMRDKGLIEYNKNNFRIIDFDELHNCAGR
ncbi:MAG TPA: Crp/Fnr family transcriptional regulator [Clostridia bacterium]|nr:Crp/Fnr family transcriptional regulator [Clostridia bacterium]